MAQQELTITMKKQILNLSLIFLIFLISIQIISAQVTQEEISALKEFEGQELPEIAGKFFGNEKITLYIDSNSNQTQTISITTKDKKFESITTQEIENPTINAYTSQETITKIKQSQNPLEEFASSLENGEITYKGATFTSKIKLTFIKIFSEIAGWFA